jgi:hypothetical protein
MRMCCWRRFDELASGRLHEAGRSKCFDQRGDAKLSLIMSGKQRPDISYLKAVHKELQIDANVLLEAV